MRKSLLWFRNDLRLDDHRPLEAALKASDKILGVYFFEDRWFESGSHGGPRMDARRAFFLWESAVELRERMRNLGSDLLILGGNPVERIPQLCDEFTIDAVYASRGFTWEETQQESQLQRALGHSTHWKSFWNTTLFTEHDLPFEVDRLPSVFTEFRKSVEKNCAVGSPIPAPDWIPGMTVQTPVDAYQAFTDIDVELPGQQSNGVLDFRGGAAAGMERLQHYFWQTDAVATYKETRNGLLGADYSTKFSPWLSAGCLSPRRIYAELKRYESERTSNSSTYWVFFELLWREFFQWVALQHGASLFAEYGWKGQRRQWRRDQALFKKWCAGETGDDFVDANMRELNTTGFMSNRGRQNVASFLCHQYKIDWRWGASYFEQRLLDYDAASNWGNWAYVSGVGNDPRKDRVFNTQGQAERYDPEGAYRKKWLKD